jgi:formate hydrogenlyase subunit 6/NADH:ubiquinone oxidoreductase subunit I
MKMTTMLGDVMQSLFKPPATRQYPCERQEPPERLRGCLHWDSTNCIGCGLCAKDCPANAIEVIVLDKKAKRFVVRYHLDRCLFCGQCVESCPRNCLELSQDDWELAALSKEPFTLYYGDDADVKIARTGLSEADIDQPVNA